MKEVVWLKNDSTKVSGFVSTPLAYGQFIKFKSKQLTMNSGKVNEMSMWALKTVEVA